jgi:hypothetical protein
MVLFITTDVRTSNPTTMDYVNLRGNMTEMNDKNLCDDQREKKEAQKFTNLRCKRRAHICSR